MFAKIALLACIIVPLLCRAVAAAPSDRGRRLWVTLGSKLHMRNS